MKIKCVYNTGKNIPNVLYELGGYSINMEFSELTIDKVYIVYAIFIMKGEKWYLICSDDYNGININYPVFFPSSLFEIVDNYQSKYWISKKMKDYYSKSKYPVINIGFANILKEEYFLGNLVEGYEREILLFKKYKELIDNDICSENSLLVTPDARRLRYWLFCHLRLRRRPSKSSSGRTEPNNLNEKLAMDEAKTGMGKVMMHCEIKHPNW